jgi:hypothetical protein
LHQNKIFSRKNNLNLKKTPNPTNQPRQPRGERSLNPNTKGMEPLAWICQKQKPPPKKESGLLYNSIGYGTFNP